MLKKKKKFKNPILHGTCNNLFLESFILAYDNCVPAWALGFHKKLSFLNETTKFGEWSHSQVSGCTQLTLCGQVMGRGRPLAKVLASETWI